MGCCQSSPRNDSQSSPYSPSNIHGDASSRAITSAPPQIPDTSSPRTSSQVPPISERSLTHRHLALGEQFNAPLRPHIWTSKRSWTLPKLNRERQEFFDTRVTGHAEIWATLKVVVGLLRDGDVSTAQSIVDAAGITVPTGDLNNGVYDEAGNLYQLPEHVISDPENIVVDREDILKGEGEGESKDVTDDDEEEEMERKREEKGKQVLKSGDVVKVRCRLSDRGGPDVVVCVGKDQPVRVLVRRVVEEANVSFSCVSGGGDGEGRERERERLMRGRLEK
ncbi:hypothetical protein OEA41_007681 [Lepraria neglecta]|uniref:DC-UbP/UBTD2 N-terminal domain-containing protein n=1 Tax=Lepraria neglecta TaxID=209136 RepID=A0AAD9ZD61_9LECA|nr:hypothetical protein OEA41_007681 [Lepraria neglecta]